MEDIKILKIGQINKDSILGKIIYDLCKKEEIKNIVEIGTWNGLGTTKCIYDSILENNKKEYSVYSLESNPDLYQIALHNLPKISNFEIILGRIVEKSELVDIDSCPDFFFINGSSRETQRSWFNDDLKNYNSVDNVIDRLPKTIDLLILDGGEFSSFAEFTKLQDRVTYLVLDDTKVIKNYEVANIVRNDSSYQIIIDSSDRNGFLVAKKIK